MESSQTAHELEALDHLRYGDSSIETFWGEEGRRFTNYTRVSVFEARDGQGHYYADLDDDGLRAQLRNDAPRVRQGRRLRIIFLDRDECNADLLQMTSSTMQLVLKTYGIANRFSFYLSRQQMAEAQCTTIPSQTSLSDSSSGTPSSSGRSPRLIPWTPTTRGK